MAKPVPMAVVRARKREMETPADAGAVTRWRACRIPGSSASFPARIDPRDIAANLVASVTVGTRDAQPGGAATKAEAVGAGFDEPTGEGEA